MPVGFPSASSVAYPVQAMLSVINNPIQTTSVPKSQFFYIFICGFIVLLFSEYKEHSNSTNRKESAESSSSSIRREDRSGSVDSLDDSKFDKYKMSASTTTNHFEYSFYFWYVSLEVSRHLSPPSARENR